MSDQKKIEVRGETVRSLVDSLSDLKEFVIEILNNNGIVYPFNQEWYSRDAWILSLRQVGEKLGTSALFSIGRNVFEQAIFPPELVDLKSALESIDVAYYMNHQNGDIGHYKLAFFEEFKATMICDNPYPCDFDRGIITSISLKFIPEQTFTVKVVHDESKSCRSKGGDSCTYQITW